MAGVSCIVIFSDCVRIGNHGPVVEERRNISYDPVSRSSNTTVPDVVTSLQLCEPHADMDKSSA